MIAGAPGWMNWLIVYPSIAIGALMVVAMLGLVVFGLTAVAVPDDEGPDDAEFLL